MDCKTTNQDSLDVNEKYPVVNRMGSSTITIGASVSVDNSGNITVKTYPNSYKEPIHLSADEEKAVDIVFAAVADLGFDTQGLHIEKRTENYISVVTSDRCDFCRIKMGKQSKWISLSLGGCKDSLSDDPRLINVTKRNLRHWKIKLDSVDDVALYFDIIQKSFKTDTQIPD